MIIEKDIYNTLLVRHRAGDPVGGAISETEAHALAYALIERLQPWHVDLDFTISSLPLLESILAVYAEHFLHPKNEVDTHVLQLVRELASYIGIAFVKNSQAEWSTTSNSVLTTDIRYRYSTTGRELSNLRILAYPIVSLAVQMLFAGVNNKPTNLDKVLLSNKRRRPRSMH